MITEFSGKITFANGLAAQGVEVRIFDQDALGKGDDELTLEPAVTDARGRFTARYDPGRYLDFATLPLLGLRVPDPLDILAPYLHLRYPVDGTQRVFHARLVPFKNHYRLPEPGPVQFLPSFHGFAFPNNFPPIVLPITLAGMSHLTRITGGYGLCGGMSAAASDYYLAGRPVPARADVPRVREKLHRYLFRRALDSFQLGESVLRFAQWMALDDEGPNSVARLTLAEVEKLRLALDGQRLAPIGLVIASGRGLKRVSNDVWKNHQVLAYGYVDHPDGSLDVRVYDPNAPGRDDVFLHITYAPSGGPTNAAAVGVKCTPVNLHIYPAQVRGFFLMPYEPVEPPEDL